MLYKTNIFGMIGSNNNLEHKQDTVMIWDDLNKKELCKLTFNEMVLNLKMNREKIFVVCQYKIFVFNLKNFQLIDNVETGNNPKGLIDINYEIGKTILAFPHKEKGQVGIKKYYEKNNNIYINAHENEIANIALNYNGLFLATASKDGKKIRIFETDNGTLLQELNRGKEKAEIKCIAMDYKNQFLAASSERGTIHIWTLVESLEKIQKMGKIINMDENQNIQNSKSIFSGLPKIFGGGFFQNEWSFAQVRLEEPYSIFTFGIENSLIIICSTGKYYKAKIDLQKGGNCQIIQEEQL